MTKQNKILLTGAIIVVIAIAVGGFFMYQHSSTQKSADQSKNQNTQQTATNNQPTIVNQTQTIQPIIKSQPTTQTSSWKTFKDSYGFQMQFSSDKTVMNVPTSKTITCNGSCPSEVTVNGIASAYTNQNINGTDYCIYSGAKKNATGSYNEYLFVTINNGNCYGLDVSYSSYSCSDQATTQSCQSKESENQALISKALSSIKFTK